VALATLDRQYRAATEGAALLDRSQAGKLALSGSGAIEFLDSVLSNDIAAVAVGGGVEAALLTHNGRMLAEVRVLRTEQELLLDTERVALQALFDALHQFRLGYDAALHKRTLECGLLSLIGPGADAALALVPGAELHAHQAGSLAGRGVRVIRTEVGVDLLCAGEDVAAVVAQLTAAGATAIEEETAETLRIEHGRPRFGVEIDERTMPQEAGLHERTVSYSKGCYIGQETVARLYWKGKPNRHLRGLALSEPAAAGAELLLGERQVGTLGSFTSSPRFGPIGLALLRREAEPGALLTFAEHAGSATVVELPFGAA
jgi:folate-binding protein YgfZ